jgi:hypothetical protein
LLGGPSYTRYKIGYKEENGDMTISAFLRAVISSTDEQDLATRGVVRDAVYVNKPML